MSYYPVLSVPQFEGTTTIFNFAPNNWEERFKGKSYLNVSYSDGDVWRNVCLDAIEYDTSVAITRADLSAYFNNIDPKTTFYLSLGSEPARESSDSLPRSSASVTSFPVWRATLGLIAPTGASTSYQGEVDPFPAPGSLLTFGYFIQPCSDVKNFLLFINLENSPKQRKGLLEVRDASHPTKLLAEFSVTNNRLNIISLDHFGFTAESLPLFLCRQMSGIPLYFAYTNDFCALSLEHTHPPASSVIFGDRFGAQKIMKNFWFTEIGPR